MSWYSDNKDKIIIFLFIFVILFIIGTILYFLLRPSQTVTPTMIPSIVLRPNPTITKSPTQKPPIPTSNQVVTTALSPQTAISPFEQEMFTRVNDYRVSQGLGKLLLDARLVKAAKGHNDLMSAMDTMSHQLPGELPLANPGNNDDRYDAVNYDWNFAAENVAAGYQTPSAVMTGWINSPGHKANILTTSARDIGVAYNPNGNYWTQNFGNSYGPNQPLS